MRKSPLPSEWKCRYCGEIKPIDEICLNSRGYIKGICRSCYNARAREYRLRTGITKNPMSFMRPSPTEKRCPQCKEVKPLSEFYQNRIRKSSSSYCKPCTKEGWKKYNKLNGVCKVLKEHHETLNEDPERLSTDFIRDLIDPGLNCKDDSEVAAE